MDSFGSQGGKTRIIGESLGKPVQTEVRKKQRGEAGTVLQEEARELEVEWNRVESR